ncbi:hypothetical protein P5673_021662 [Acropora cervicornis]|uniref:YqaJ viral recombinase domain-containing protein n=1 Tax=Acropora cervicornis TaxID=6130 RepID=A0AAD9Q849_ACRCE|nr:hypothetical protein P5673_021662 [Acropora cervicornis]
MAEFAVSEHPDFWHKNLKTVPRFSTSFIDKFTADHLPIKATLVRGYKFFYEDYIHDVEVPHLACSPDRRVYDTTEEDPWGLLEIKSSVAELNYPKFHEQNGKYSL